MTDEQIIEKLATEVMRWGANWRQHNYGEPWEPLRRMDHAWMIVHKLWHEDGRTIWVGPDTVDGGYAAQYRPDQKSMLVDFMREETAPRAICYAALKVKGIEVDAECRSEVNMTRKQIYIGTTILLIIQIGLLVLGVWLFESVNPLTRLLSLFIIITNLSFGFINLKRLITME